MSIDTDDIIIDESSHRPAPTYWQRIKHVVMSVLMGMVFVQVLLFAFRMVSIAYYYLTLYQSCYCLPVKLWNIRLALWR